MTDAIITSDLIYSDLAWQEVKKSVINGRRQATLGDGVALISFKERFTGLAEKWRQKPPVFVRHICPVSAVIGLDGSVDDLKQLKKVARDELADEIPTGADFSVQTRILAKGYPLKPFDINQPFHKHIASLTGATLNVRAPVYVVSLTIAHLEGRLVALVGVSHVTHNLSDWAGGVRRYRREKEQVSRAEFKLLEAFEQFNLKLPNRGMGLDLGAAPGGWTRVLRQKSADFVVVAVDPGALHPSFDQDWGVRHEKMTAEKHLKTLKPETQYDCIVNDMRLDARRSADIVTAYAPYLKEDGFIIMTVKLPQRKPKSMLDQTTSILRKTFRIRSVRQLFHNRNEVTVYLTPKRRKGSA